MSFDDSGERKARIMKASRLLEARIGIGPVDEAAIKRSQDIIDRQVFDFQSFGLEYVVQFDKARKEAEEAGDEAAIQDMAVAVMQIKANAPMFGYEFAGRLACTMLAFLEMAGKPDRDVLDIAAVFSRTMMLVLKGKMAGDGGTSGADLQKELQDACKRYFTRKGDGRTMPEDDAFFVDIQYPDPETSGF